MSIYTVVDELTAAEISHFSRFDETWRLFPPASGTIHGIFEPLHQLVRVIDDVQLDTFPAFLHLVAPRFPHDGTGAVVGLFEIQNRNCGGNIPDWWEKKVSGRKES